MMAVDTDLSERRENPRLFRAWDESRLSALILGMSDCSYESMNREKFQVNDLEAHDSLGRG
jgi:hypothetical protein